MVSFAKVAEYQQRAAIHFHAVVRLDGPSGPGAAPPSWAPPELLADAVRAAAASVTVRVPESAAYGAEALGWGAHNSTSGRSARSVTAPGCPMTRWQPTWPSTSPKAPPTPLPDSTTR